ncbi:glycosyltransferase [Haloferax massiliensis]|uniref:GDP-mannose-dependent alpha-(1-6)-phosphatidylinositol monomannoside mannosyltransferase n=1 Tax=Haloferax massiliensis TaxID=1476858 RepID=A0A0D6JMC1_9EURY|nr:glycosyltransferase [Haloferax massiliensis]CQR48748.1 GDP-mannose-dependent alpha-(1-6)-phosphatidylinositol monomannoside mannosyltransferase [Haloferax massiliensis]
MRACIAIPSLSTHGGAERVVCEQIQYLSSEGWGVTLLVADYDQAILDDYGVPHSVNIVVTSGGLIDDILTVRKILSEEDIDLFLTHTFTKRVYLATRPFGDDTPYIPHVHGTVLWFVDEPNRLPHANSRSYQELISSVPGHGEFYDELSPSSQDTLHSYVNEWLEKRALQSSSTVITGSHQVQRELENLYSVNSLIARPGVSKAWISQYEETEHLSLTNHDYTILSVSRLDKRKRVSLLIKAVGSLRQDGYDVGLVVAGTGERREHLENLSEKLGIRDSVIFAGFVPENKLPSYYKSADVFACPGWMSYGITPLEAYAMRTPVGVSSDAFVNEVLTGKPGVEVVQPNIDEWVEMIPKLLKVDPTSIDPSIVPTWEQYGLELHKIINRLVVDKSR